MKITTRIFLLLQCVLLWSFIPIAQTHRIDSLRSVLKIQKEDSNKVKTLLRLSFALYSINPDSTIILGKEAYNLSEKLNLKWDIGHACDDMGIGYYMKGDYPDALNSYQKALQIWNEMGAKGGQAASLGNMGIVYDDQGDFPKALEYYLKSLKISEEMGNKRGQADQFGNIGVIYDRQGDFPKALDYYQRALKMEEEAGNKQAVIVNLGNIGNIYSDEAKYPEALKYDEKALKMCQETGDKKSEAKNLGNIGNIYYAMHQYPKALDYDQRALNLNKQLGDSHGQAINYGNMGALYTKTGNFKDGEICLKRAISIDSSIGDWNSLRQMDEYISRLYDTTGRYQLAFYWYKKAMILKDTLFNIDKNKALTRRELTYKFQHQADSVKAEQAQKDAIADASAKKQKAISISVSGGLIIVILFSIILFNRFRMTQKQKRVIEDQKAIVEKQKDEVEKKNAVIEQQKQLVEEKNKDILDSIKYAKRLQDAILPPLSIVKKHVPDSFLLYKPKDIVAGDFYWMEKDDDVIMLAACDCTGHGVPGALVSVVCSNALNRTVQEFHITETGKILDKVRELVLETFEKSEDNVQDGMDISLASISYKTSVDNTVSVQWSGAFNPLCYVQNGVMQEIAANKQPIGKIDNPVPFNTHNLKLQKGDILYLLTDGYADQFGGPRGKKFKYQQLQELLIANHTKPMEEQKKVLQDTIESWRAGLEQVDDMLVIGVRL